MGLNLKSLIPGSKVNSNKTANVPDNKTVQEWIPFTDISENMIFKRDKSFVAGIKIEPLNMDLLSDNEKKRIIKSLHEAINGLRYHIQIISVGRPVDLDPYIASLHQKSKDTTDFVRKKLLQGNVKHAASLASSGETLERKFYILMPQPPGKKAIIELRGRVQELVSLIRKAGLDAHICSDQDLIELEFIFLNPAHSAYERSPVFTNNLPPQLNI